MHQAVQDGIGQRVSPTHRTTHPRAAGLSLPWHSFRTCRPSAPAGRCAAPAVAVPAPSHPGQETAFSTAVQAASCSCHLPGCVSVQPATGSDASTVRCNPAGRHCCPGHIPRRFYRNHRGRLSAGSALRPDDQTDETFIEFADSDAEGQTVVAHLLGIDPPTIIVKSDPLAVLALVQSGRGVYFAVGPHPAAIPASDLSTCGRQSHPASRRDKPVRWR